MHHKTFGSKVPHWRYEAIQKLDLDFVHLITSSSLNQVRGCPKLRMHQQEAFDSSYGILLVEQQQQRKKTYEN